MEVERDNVISITPRQVYKCRLSSSDLLLLNRVAIQLSSRGWMDSVTDLIDI